MVHVVSPSLLQKLTLHPLNDPTEFGSLSDLYGISRKEGYGMMAVTTKYWTVYSTVQHSVSYYASVVFTEDTTFFLNLPEEVSELLSRTCS